jgi:hypothetical protein
MNKKLFRQFNSGCNFEREHQPQMTLGDLAQRYKRALHPALRSTACIKLMGFDLLHD